MSTVDGRVLFQNPQGLSYNSRTLGACQKLKEHPCHLNSKIHYICGTIWPKWQSSLHSSLDLLLSLLLFWVPLKTSDFYPNEVCDSSQIQRWPCRSSKSDQKQQLALYLVRDILTISTPLDPRNIGSNIIKPTESLLNLRMKFTDGNTCLMLSYGFTMCFFLIP